MNSTEPAQRLRAASTEAASRLQMLQVGAQNQNTTGRPASSDPSNSPPPTNGARKFNAAGTVMTDWSTLDADALLARGAALEHPTVALTRAMTAIAAT